MNEHKFYFLSTGRCGTSFLSKIFQKYYPELGIKHQEKWSRLINIVGNLPISKKYSFFLIKKIFSLTNTHYLPQSTIDPLKSISIAKLLSYKNLNIEKYKIVHLVRDPRTFVASFMNWKELSYKKKILHNFIPFWMPKYRYTNNLQPIKKSLDNKFKDFCYVWYSKNIFFYNTFCKQINYKIVRMEDLIDENKKNETFQDLIDFLNLPNKDFNYNEISSKKVNKSKKMFFPKSKNWPNEYKMFLYDLCGGLMKKFNYNP